MSGISISLRRTLEEAAVSHALADAGVEVAV